MIMRKLANTNFMSWDATKFFCKALKSLSSLEKALFLKLLRVVDLVFEYDFPKNRHLHAFPLVEYDLSIV